ncbi:MAG: AMP-binding protein [Defluviicoccus sp.]|nr:AMP-binding protein [Defluviicoccus sp.]MDE0385513.1 AMP-binding protein [Defluviicoccus sp.]
MSEPSAHVDHFLNDNLPPRALWPEMDYSVLPELAAYPARFNAAVELLDRQAAGGSADKPMFRFGGSVWTYGEVLARANRIANFLVEDCGLVPGNRVLLRSGNHPMLAAAWYAVLKAGGVAVTTMPTLRAREIEYIAGKARIQLAISHRDLAADIEAAAPSCADLRRVLYFGDPADGLEALAEAKPATFANVDTAAEDVAIVGFTSGSTGTPKGTIHFHRDLLAAADCFAGRIVDIRPGDIVCGSPQIAFLYGLCAFLVDAPRFGAETVLLERATPKLLLETIEKTRATVCFSTPSGYKLMLEEAASYDLSSLRVCVGGGEPLAPAVFERWKDITGVSMINGLGISELLHIFISAAGDDIRPGAIGKEIPGFRVRVVDEEFEDTAPGEIGQMIVRGPNGCRYLDDAERQAKYVRDGWNLSGDLCRVDEDGYVYYEARTDDMILTSGYNVSGLEVEAVLLEHPSVRECAVVGSPDPDRGAIVKAFVALFDGAVGDSTLAEELQDYVKSQISAFKYPRAIEFVDALPLTPTGKIQRGALRALERERAGTGG